MGLHIAEATYAPGQEVARHTHAQPLLALVLSGALELSSRGRRHLCARGGVFTRAEEPHANRFGPRGARLLLLGSDREVDLPPLVTDPRLSTLARQLSGELRATDAAAHLAREGLALQVLALATRAGPSREGGGGWMGRVREYMEAHLLSPLRLADLAAVAGVHPAHFGRAFRQAFGEPPAAYLRRRRLEWARTRLLAPEVSLAEVALEAGFCDQGHFTRAFRKATGLTPAQVRRGARGGQARRG
jgi:AraC family transcriptional regulator